MKIRIPKRAKKRERRKTRAAQRATTIGPCSICGTVGPLSFEHVPPKSAFNTGTYMVVEGDAVFDVKPGERPRGKWLQGGQGAYTLCASCNNKTGSWYAPALTEWYRQAMEILVRTDAATGENPRLAYPYRLFPLRVLKQIVTMFASANGPEWCADDQRIKAYLLDPGARRLPPPYRVFTYFTLENSSRSVGWCEVSRGGKVFGPLTEFTFRPFGFVMTKGSAPPSSRHVEITDFEHFLYAESTSLPLLLPLLHTVSQYPGDYRSLEQLKAAPPLRRRRIKDSWFVLENDPNAR